jgi:transcriptional regulator with XRE-family HTH domain
MDPIRVGRSARAIRLRRGWRQADVAVRCGVSPSTVSRIERGRLDGVSIGALRQLTEVLGAAFDVRLSWNGEGLDRLLDGAHAAIVEAMVRRLQGSGWDVAVEVSFAIRGERGSIDVLAYRHAASTLLVVEVKSVVPDAQAMLTALDRKARLAIEIGAVRGWRATTVARLLVLPESATSRRRIRALDRTFSTAFPARGWAVERWLRHPDGPMAGLLFLPNVRQVHAGRSITGVLRANPRHDRRSRAG